MDGISIILFILLTTLLLLSIRRYYQSLNKRSKVRDEKEKIEQKEKLKKEIIDHYDSKILSTFLNSFSEELITINGITGLFIYGRLKLITLADIYPVINDIDIIRNYRSLNSIIVSIYLSKSLEDLDSEEKSAYMKFTMNSYTGLPSRFELFLTKEYGYLGIIRDNNIRLGEIKFKKGGSNPPSEE